MSRRKKGSRVTHQDKALLTCENCGTVYKQTKNQKNCTGCKR